MVTLTIDGREVSVPEGTLVIDAAEALGIEIPRFCYHKRLSVLGACRMCLVRIEGMPKLQAACTLPVNEGMVVISNCEEVAKARAGMLEFILTNHPLDCPICDKGGECDLQSLTFRFGDGRQRFAEPRNHKGKAIRIGGNLVLDQERCILCFRCTRFLDEWADEQLFQFHDRGDRAELRPFRDDPIDRSRFAGNTIDLCPVGALTSDKSRFKGRPWELNDVESVCPHCPVGCNIVVGSRRGGIARVTPRENPEVNDGWTCDRGRYDYDWVNQRRLLAAMVRRNGELVEVSWEEAVQAAAEGLSRLAHEDGPGVVAGVMDSSACCEEGYLFSRLLRAGFRTHHVFLSTGETHAPVFSGSIQEIVNGDLLVLINADILDDQPILWARTVHEWRAGKLSIVSLSREPLEQSKWTTLSAVYQSGMEQPLMRGLTQIASGDTERSRVEQVGASVGLAPNTLLRVGLALRASRAPAVLLGADYAGDPLAVGQTLGSLARAARSSGTQTVVHGILARGANSRGLLEMGVTPFFLAAGRRADDEKAGADFRRIWGAPMPHHNLVASLAQAVEGGVRGLYLVGVGERELPLPSDWRSRARFVVYQGTNGTPIAGQADVILPAASFAEVYGQMVNFEGRLQQTRPGHEPPGRGRANWEILSEVLAALKLREPYKDVNELRAEMARIDPSLARYGQPAPLERERLPVLA